MRRGISFKIPNEYGRFLGEILKPIDITEFNWYIGGEEAYFIENGTLGEPLFSEEIYGMEGELLKDIIENNDHYIIFANFKAFPKDKNVIDLQTYEDLLKYDCQLALLVIDSEHVEIYCKDKEKLERFYHNAKINEFKNIQYITDENDFRTRLSVW